MHTRWRIKSYTPWSVHSVVMLVEAPLCTYSLCIHVGNILCAGPARCKFVGAIVMAVVVVVLLVAQPGRISALKCQFWDNYKEHAVYYYYHPVTLAKLAFLGYVNVRLQNWPKKLSCRLRDLGTAPAGGITQPRTHFFGQFCTWF